jgi:hypothetical protein
LKGKKKKSLGKNYKPQEYAFYKWRKVVGWEGILEGW